MKPHEKRIADGIAEVTKRLNNRTALPVTFSAMDLYRESADELRPVVENLLVDGLTLFAGRQKSGKSWLALQLAIAISGGRDLEGVSICDRGPVLFGALEEPKARTGARLRKLAESGEWLMNCAFFYELLPLMGGGADQLRSLIDETEARLVILDTLTAVVKASGKSSGDVFRSQYAEVDVLRKIAEEKRIAMLVLHHTRKGGGESLEAIAGTGGISAAIDTAWILRRSAEGESSMEVVGREIEDRTFALRFERETPFGWRFIGDGREQALSAERRQVLEVLRDEGGLSPAKLAVELAKSRPAVRMLLKRMASDGYVFKRNGSYFISPSLSVSDRSYREREREEEIEGIGDGRG